MSRFVGRLSLVVVLGVAGCGSVSSGTADGGTAGATGAAGAGMAGTGGASGSSGTGGSGGIGGHVPVKHRAAAVACPTDQPTGSCNPTDPGIPDGGLMCVKDADCTAGAKGRCVGSGTAVATAGAASRGATLPGCHCAYDACTTDADCGASGGPCACRPSGQGIVAPSPAATNVCMAGNCRVDGDCGAGGYCSPSLGPCGAYGGVVGYYCHTKHDTCVDDADCVARGGAGDCRYDTTANAWACATSLCAG